MRLFKQQDHLLTFLDYPLRPAVISRKISSGNKTEQGASTWEILASLAVTAHQQGDSFIDQVAQKVVLKPDALTLR